MNYDSAVEIRIIFDAIQYLTVPRSVVSCSVLDIAICTVPVPHRLLYSPITCKIAAKLYV